MSNAYLLKNAKLLPIFGRAKPHSILLSESELKISCLYLPLSVVVSSSYFGACISVACHIGDALDFVVI